MKQVYIGHKEIEMEVTMFFIVTSFLFALYHTMKFRIHFCLIVTLFFLFDTFHRVCYNTNRGTHLFHI